MVALDVLGRRGALRVLWELRDAPVTFRALQTAAEMNPASLNKRIKELSAREIIDHGGDGYHLTKHGRRRGRGRWTSKSSGRQRRSA